MLKNKLWLGIVLSIILLVFSINGFAIDYYKFTQESGDLFYVGADDKAEALEDTNELRQIVSDLGALLVHDKKNNLYPRDKTTGGTIQIPEAGLKFGNDPANDDIVAYIAGEMTWQTKAELGIDLSLYYLKTAIDTQGEVENIWGVSLANDSELHTILTLGTASGLSLNGQELSLALADTDTTGALSDTDWDTFNNKVSFPGFDTLLNDYGFIDNSTNWNTAYGWGDWSGEGFITDITGEGIGDLSDVDLTDLADNKILKYNSATSKFECEDESGAGASQLSDLSDVGSTTPTDKYVLVADGDSWESRALVEADVSDLGSYIENVSEDTTPESGGEHNFGAHSAGFTVQTIISSSGTATIDWGNSNKARITLSENTTLAFTNPAYSGNYMLIIIQPAGENAYTTTFPAGIYWSGGTKISVPTTGDNRCIVSFAFDDENSDNWYCQGTETFATDD